MLTGCPGHGEPLVGFGFGLSEAVHHFFQQVGLVGFERQHIVGPLGHNLFGNRALAAHRIQRDHTAAEFQSAQEIRDSSDLIGFVLHFDLRQDQWLCTGPGADQVDGAVPL